MGNHEFKCSSCGNKYEHDMASENDIAICKWCAGDEGYEWSL
jgi:formylmethanofuran dehydrogenase subunit E